MRAKKKWIAWGLAVCLTLQSICAGMSFSAVTADAAQTVYDTDVTEASSGCTLVGVEGSYVVEAQKALDRINEIRLEACQEGVKNPETEEALTLSDYQEIKWSSDLEYIARIRAAEASVYLEHTRPNGQDCFDLKSASGQQSWAEVLAWNWSTGLLQGIEQWYNEKMAWVNETPGAVTGHYTAMIKPGYLYVGLGCFCSKGATYFNTTSGEFSCYAGSSETAGEGASDCIQKLEVKTDNLSGYTIEGTSVLSMGETSSLTMQAKVKYESSVKTAETPVILQDVTWTSSDSSVAQVDADGTVTAKKAGTAQIQASGGNGTASLEVTVSGTAQSQSPEETSDVTKQPTESMAPVNTPAATENAGTGSTQTPWWENPSTTAPESYSPTPGTSVIYLSPVSSPTASARASAKPTAHASAKPTVRPTVKPTATAKTSDEDYDAAIPQKAVIKKLVNRKGRTCVVRVKSQANADGYMIEYGLCKGSNKNVKVVRTQKNTYKIRHLKKKQKYYVRVRAYAFGNNQTVYGAWSSKKYIKIRR